MALLRSDILNKDFIEKVIRQCEVHITSYKLQIKRTVTNQSKLQILEYFF